MSVYLFPELSSKVEKVCHFASLVVGQAFENVNGERQQAVWGLGGHLLNVHPSVGAGDEHWPVVLPGMVGMREKYCCSYKGS